MTGLWFRDAVRYGIDGSKVANPTQLQVDSQTSPKVYSVTMAVVRHDELSGDAALMHVASPRRTT